MFSAPKLLIVLALFFFLIVLPALVGMAVWAARKDSGR